MEIMTLDIPNAFIQVDIPKKDGQERIVMKLRGRLVTWLCKIDPIAYQNKVVYENGIKVFYLEVMKAIYGMLVAVLLWHRQIQKDLESIGFKFNPYDECVANRYDGDKQ